MAARSAPSSSSTRGSTEDQVSASLPSGDDIEIVTVVEGVDRAASLLGDTPVRRAPRRLHGLLGAGAASSPRPRCAIDTRPARDRPLHRVAERLRAAGVRGGCRRHRRHPAAPRRGALRDPEGDRAAAERLTPRRGRPRPPHRRARPQGRHRQDADGDQPRRRHAGGRPEGRARRPRPPVRRHRPLHGPRPRAHHPRPRRSTASTHRPRDARAAILVTHESGVKVLIAPSRPDQASSRHRRDSSARSTRRCAPPTTPSSSTRRPASPPR